MEDLLNVGYNYILTKGLPFCIPNPNTILHYLSIFKFDNLTIYMLEYDTKDVDKMKITINQDLIKIVERSNGVFKLQQGTILEVKICTIFISAGIGAGLMAQEFDSEWIKYILTMSTLAMLGSLLAEKVFTTIECNQIKENSSNILNGIIICLKENGIDTSLEFIKKAVNTETKYKLSKESFPPKIIQTKTISIPSYTIFPNVKESFIEQQHELGSEQYVLTLGSASKKRKLVPRYNQV